MKLTDNKYITTAIAKSLSDWTMGQLATTTPAKLSKVKGISKVTAERIIKEAQRLVNQDFEAPDVTHASEFSEPAMSVRVRRIKEAAAKNA